jgi:Fe-S cluster assembly protein SufD
VLARGFPTRKDENWRFTDVSALLAADLVRAPARVTATVPAGATATPIAEALAGDARRLEPWLGRTADPKAHGFVAFSTAAFDCGVVVEIARGAVLDRPIEIEISREGGSPPPLSLPRVLVLAGAGSRAVVIERHHGGGAYASLPVGEIGLERGADLTHVRVQRESTDAWHVATLAVRQEAASRFTQFSIALGARLARLDLGCLLAGEQASSRLLGLYLGNGTQLLDHHTEIDHAVPATRSREVYKGILDGRARGVFRGKVHVRPHAQKIDADQTSRSLLLGDDAIANAKPQLEIYANDVKCSHGATIGRLSGEALFYLRSRGIGPAEARALLTYAFASEIARELPTPELVREVEDFVLAWLPGGSRAEAP